MLFLTSPSSMLVGGKSNHTHSILGAISPAVIDGTDILYREYVDISIAVATPKVRQPHGKPFLFDL